MWKQSNLLINISKLQKPRLSVKTLWCNHRHCRTNWLDDIFICKKITEKNNLGIEKLTSDAS